MGQKWVELAISKEATKDAEEEKEEEENEDQQFVLLLLHNWSLLLQATREG